VNAAVGRRLVAEFSGTGLLVAVVVGSRIAAIRLTSDSALRLLVNSLATALGLAVLILVLIEAGGAHFNPVVTAADAQPALSPSQHYRGGAPILLSEVVAAAGLLFVIVSLAPTGR
jgi:glycerol uptake facilitator-like aquaporin